MDGNRLVIYKHENYTNIRDYLLLLSKTEESLAEILSENLGDQDQKNPVVVTSIVSLEALSRSNATLKPFDY